MTDSLFEPISLAIFLLISGIGGLLAASRSSWFVEYAFIVVAFNRCLRRIVDYNNEYFNPYSLISLTPLVVCGFATAAVIGVLFVSSGPEDARLRKVLIPYGIAVGFAFVVGLLNSKAAAIYSLGEYLAPIGLVAYGAWFAADPKICDRWCRSFCLIVFVVACYGLWQFYTIPPWDAFWLLAVDFDGYLGQPEPTKMTMFTTMQERGPAGMFLASGVILLLLRGVFPNVFRWSLVMVIGYAMLLTYTRTSVILCIAACVLFPLINRGANIKVLLATVLALSVVAPSVVRFLPGSEQAIARVSTLTNLQEDGSFQGRLRFFRYSLTEALYEPLGLGLGSHGIASKAGTASRAGMGDSTGYVQTLRTFGWIGTFLVIVCLVRLWGASNRAMAFDGSDITVLFYRSWFASGMVVFYSGDWLFTATFFWVLAGYVVGKSNEESMGDLSAWDDEQEYGSDDAEAQQIGLVGALFHK